MRTDTERLAGELRNFYLNPNVAENAADMIERLADALGFYADKENWETGHWHHAGNSPVDPSLAEIDGGQNARAALNSGADREGGGDG